MLIAILVSTRKEKILKFDIFTGIKIEKFSIDTAILEKYAI